MEAPMKYICLAALLVILGIAQFNGAYGAGECGKSTPDREAWKLVPCASAAKDANAAPSSSCCAQVKLIGQNPSCLCAVMMSNTAKMAGVKPEIAITIPKRCNLSERPVGMKCGGTLTYCNHFDYRNVTKGYFHVHLQFTNTSCSVFQHIHYPEDHVSLSLGACCKDYQEVLEIVSHYLCN